MKAMWINITYMDKTKSKNTKLYTDSKYKIKEKQKSYPPLSPMSFIYLEDLALPIRK
jgi:hypothetical protein